jgi:hypothetical protein
LKRVIYVSSGEKIKAVRRHELPDSLWLFLGQRRLLMPPDGLCLVFLAAAAAQNPGPLAAAS